MKGFTLVELLVVIGIIVILMTAALVAINPFKQFAMANNANRWSGVTTMMNAVSQRMVDNKGKLDYDEPGFVISDCPAKDDDIPAFAIITNIDDGNPATFEYDLCPALVTDYIGALPRDPQEDSSPVTDCLANYDTRYSIQCSSNRITICAEDTQIPPEPAKICITR